MPYIYQKSFAYFPKWCKPGEYVWLKNYYEVWLEHWESGEMAVITKWHVYNITSQYYLVRKLAENL